jgi:hypothetical protein
LIQPLCSHWQGAVGGLPYLLSQLPQQGVGERLAVLAILIHTLPLNYHLLGEFPQFCFIWTLLEIEGLNFEVVGGLIVKRRENFSGM